MFEAMIPALERAAISAGDFKAVTAKVRDALEPFLAGKLPDTHCAGAVGCYTRHLIHCDPQGRWCAVAIVLAPGQSNPIHNHHTWGVIGVVRGRETEIRYRRAEDGTLAEIKRHFNHPGEMSVVIPPWDVHRIEGAAEDGGNTISIHVYGGDVNHVTKAIFEQAGLSYVIPCAP